MMSRRSPLHVALVTGHADRIGGMETFCRFLARTIVDHDCRLTVALSGRNIYRKDECPRSVDWVNAGFAGDREYLPGRVLDRRAWFREQRPDVAVVVQTSNTPFRCAIAGAALAGVPVVVTHRTLAWPVEDPPARRHLCGLVRGLHLHRRRMIFKTWLTSALARAVVYNSQGTRDSYEQLYGYSPAKGVVIPNAVTMPTAAPPRPGGRPFTIGYFGRIGADKRLDLLIRAVERMQHRDARVVLWGEGAAQDELVLLARGLGLEQRIEWAGPLDEPGAALARCDVVALCSPRESSSNMVLEAMAAGRAVVVSDTGGMAEMVDRGRCGLLVPALDVPALAGALDRLAGDQDLCDRLGHAARNHVGQQHDPAAVAEAWLNLLHRVARQPAAVRSWSPGRAEARA